MQRAAQRLDAIAGFPIGSFGKGFNGLNHEFLIQNARNEMGRGGRNRLAAVEREVGKQRVGQGTSDFRESVAVIEKKGCPPVTGLKKLKYFQQCQAGRAALFPLFSNRLMSFRVNASLRAASFTESIMDLGDRCPVPVLEKVGSAL